MKKFLKNILTEVFNNLVGQIATGIIGLAITAGLILRFKGFLFQSVNILMAYVVIFAIAFLFFIYFFITKRFKREQYYIPTRRTLHTGLELSDYDRETKWNYKRADDFYFVPLISYSQYSADFITFCGPFCAKCDHFLQIKELSINPKYFCVNCVKRYKVPAELLGDYDEKLLAYFKEEYRKKNLRDSHKI